MFTNQQKRQLRNNKIKWEWDPDGSIEFRYGVGVMSLMPHEVITKIHQMGWESFIVWLRTELN